MTLFLKLLAFLFFGALALGGLIVSIKFMWATMGLWLGFLAIGLMVGGIGWVVRRLNRAS